MKTLLIPVDFTPASENAVNFGAAWGKKYQYERIILLRSHYTSMYEGMIVSGELAYADQGHLNKTRLEESTRLTELARELDKKTGSGISVETAITEMPLLRSIIEVIKSEQPATILIGSDKMSHANESFISGKVIAIAKASPIRVLIVPASYSYQPVQKALVPCNFKALETLNKINGLRTSPQWHHVQLMVLNVDEKQQYLDPDKKFREAENNLHNYLEKFHHEIFYDPNKDVINGILSFIEKNEAQLMIALPGRYSFLYSLTHSSISEALYREARLPVMILK